MVARVRLALGGRRSQTFQLEQRSWTEIIVTKALVFDIPPWSVARRISWLARLGSGFGVKSI
jgi:hypothetical protein